MTDRYIIVSRDPQLWDFAYVVVDTFIPEHIRDGRWVHQTNSFAVAIRVRDELHALMNAEAAP